MATLDEGTHPGEFIVSELPGTLSRDTGTVDVPAATKLLDGAVLGQISATGHYAEYDEANSDGTEEAGAVLVGELDNSAGLAPASMDAPVINFGAEVRSAALSWKTGVDDAAGLVDLRAVGIKAR